MKKIELQELKQLQLQIMDEIHNFCLQNSINYSICGGTLIGAVRHKGYIPWDDDIDIMMPRPDYEKFSSLFNEQNSDLKFINCFNDKQYFQPFGKVVNTRTFMTNAYDRPLNNLGVNIDVFPCDGLPADENERGSYWKKIAKEKNWNTLYYQKVNEKEHGIKKIARKIFFTLFKIFPANRYAKKINQLAQKNVFETSEYVACSIFGYGRKEEMPKSVFNSFVDVPFENRTFKAMEGYKTYLTNLYGDYMQLPPEEKRVAKHDFEVWWR